MRFISRSAGLGVWTQSTLVQLCMWEFQGHLRDRPEDCGVEARADGRPGRPRAHAVLAVLPTHAQPVEGVRAQQRQRVRHRQTHICINDLRYQSFLSKTPILP